MAASNTLQVAVFSRPLRPVVVALQSKGNGAEVQSFVHSSRMRLWHIAQVSWRRLLLTALEPWQVVVVLQSFDFPTVRAFPYYINSCKATDVRQPSLGLLSANSWYSFYSASALATFFFLILITKSWLKYYERIPYIFATLFLTAVLNALFNSGATTGAETGVNKLTSGSNGIQQWTASLPLIATLSGFMSYLMVLVLRAWPVEKTERVQDQESAQPGSRMSFQAGLFELSAA
jgi:hypothetical protein